MIEKHHWLKRTALIVFGGLMMVYFTSEVATGIKGLNEQTLTYQNQKILKKHVSNFAIDLADFAKHYDQNNWENQDALRDVYYPDINNYRRQLYAEGVRSTNLENLFEKHRNVRTPAEMITNLNEIAGEFSKMADRLPTSDKNP